ncbi:hypothetical protein M426DRAFT_8176 [Hypoxylon sp. CI-4A]|nr:hypothetical protein M426DRAFT_8176 [Hypoxylon sp. CI-4A]
MSGGDGVWRPIASFDKNEARWPLPYSITPAEAHIPRKHWCHTYYRGPENRPVQVLYSSDKARSEVIAQGFLNQPVLGFDMEWYWLANESSSLHQKVSLIQLACEHKIGLFHIALHDGHTSEDLIAPSLRRIIESAQILKTGVNILQADMSRLQKHFQLQPRGAFELSHLYNLITYGPLNPKRVTVRLCALSKQVETYLGLPLFKGDVRTSNWSAPLDDDQKRYAATDAYAGYMLFHRMNTIRLNMDVIPPLPRLAESYLPFGWAERTKLVELEPATDGVSMTAMAFFALSEKKAEYGNKKMMGTSNLDNQTEEKTPVAMEPVANVSSAPQLSIKLYERLVSNCNRHAAAEDVPHYFVASNQVLKDLATYRPANKDELLDIHGVGQSKYDKYGSEWLEIIALDLLEHPKNTSHPEMRRPLQSKSPNKSAGYSENSPKKQLEPGLSRELYRRLSEHRKARAAVHGWPAFRVVSNKILEAIVNQCPSNKHELLLVFGVGKAKVAEYGDDWLRIIKTFQSERNLGPTRSLASGASTNSRPAESARTPTSPSPPRHLQPHMQLINPLINGITIKNVGRSKELIMPQSLQTTGLSFTFAETQLDVDEAPGTRTGDSDNHEFDDPYASEMHTNPPKSPQTNRRHDEFLEPPSENAHTSPPIVNSDIPSPIPAPEPLPAPPPPVVAEEAVGPSQLSLQQKILRKKLDAYVRSVIWAMNPKPEEPIVSASTLDCLVTTLPQSLDQLQQVAGIQCFIQACETAKKDLWKTFSTWTRAQGLVPDSQLT